MVTTVDGIRLSQGPRGNWVLIFIIHLPYSRPSELVKARPGPAPSSHCRGRAFRRSMDFPVTDDGTGVGLNRRPCQGGPKRAKKAPAAHFQVRPASNDAASAFRAFTAYQWGPRALPHAAALPPSSPACQDGPHSASADASSVTNSVRRCLRVSAEQAVGVSPPPFLMHVHGGCPGAWRSACSSAKACHRSTLSHPADQFHRLVIRVSGCENRPGGGFAAPAGDS
jgi:hypothetical protein